MKKLILNNKSFLGIKEIEKYKEEIGSITGNIDIILFPNIIYLTMFDNYSHKIGTQNFYSFNEGSYTGEINLHSLKEIGINYTLLGHSERIINKLDSKSIIKEKLKTSLDAEFNSILIVGEPKYLKDPFKSIKSDLKYYLKEIGKNKIEKLSIMYEPSWLDDGSQDLNIIRKVVIDIKEYFIKNYKTDVDVYYGSGVNKNNINEILEVCDGVGIGKKSIDIKFIKSIIDKISQSSTTIDK